MSFQDIRDNAKKFPNTLWINKGAKGAAIGRLTSVFKAVGLPSGSRRQARLRLASEVFERPVASFNDLQDSESWALDQWVLSGQAREELPDWLRQLRT